MYIDAFEEFSHDQAITATAVSTNVKDLQKGSTDNTTLDIGSGCDTYLVLRCGTAFDNLTSLQIDLDSDSTADLATSPTTHITETFALAALTANTILAVYKLPPGDYERYLGINYTVTGTTPTAGTIDAYLTPNAPSQAGPNAKRSTISV